ncbi:MAG: hypothetical protein FJ315_07190 [SAR202 cluster bacterium]|nr:hypothetical protein [SAR202 cluster bacterium]
MDAAKLFPLLPTGLRAALLDEFRRMVQNYLERRWSPAELSGGRFSEVVWTILDGHAKGSYPASPSKPRDLVAACRALESNSHVPRSFQILIPRLLTALYEIRNNRGVGHVGGDVNPNHMDSNAVLGMSSWVMAELVRVFHGLTVPEAQQIVDSIVEPRMPLVWSGPATKRVLDPTLPLQAQVLLLLATEPGDVAVSDLLVWCDCPDKGYFSRLLRRLHKQRLIELSLDEARAQILPPGTARVAVLAGKGTAA